MRSHHIAPSSLPIEIAQHDDPFSSDGQLLPVLHPLRIYQYFSCSDAACTDDGRVVFGRTSSTATLCDTGTARCVRQFALPVVPEDPQRPLIRILPSTIQYEM